MRDGYSSQLSLSVCLLTLNFEGRYILTVERGTNLKMTNKSLKCATFLILAWFLRKSGKIVPLVCTLGTTSINLCVITQYLAVFSRVICRVKLFSFETLHCHK